MDEHALLQIIAVTVLAVIALAAAVGVLSYVRPGIHVLLMMALFAASVAVGVFLYCRFSAQCGKAARTRR